jgi:hypothetical protein
MSCKEKKTYLNFVKLFLGFIHEHFSKTLYNYKVYVLIDFGLSKIDTDPSPLKGLTLNTKHKPKCCSPSPAMETSSHE